MHNRNHEELIQAVTKGDHVKTSTLLRNGANVNDVNDEGFTLLAIAIKERNNEIIDLLLENNANVNAVHPTGVTPLILAVQEGDSSIVKKLLDKGSNVYTTDNKGISAFDIANQRENTDIAELMKKHEPDLEYHPYVGYSQQHFINVMQLLGYKSDPRGICFGISHMTKQAILAGDLETFERRLKLIYSMTPEELIKAIQENHKLPMQKHGEPFIQGINQDSLLASIHPFCNGVDLYMQPDAYKEWFPTRESSVRQSDIAVDLLLPETLRKAGGIQTIDRLTGVYSHSELVNHFASLDNIMKDANLNAPVAFTIIGGIHAIEMGYDPKSGWLEFDPNNMPHVKRHESFETLARHVSDSQFGDSYAVLSTNIHALNSDSVQLKAALKKWKDLPSFQMTHDVNNKEKLEAYDQPEITWLYIASKDGFTNIVEQLLKNGADVNKANYQGITPLYKAAVEGHLEIVEMLLEHGADIKNADNEGKTALMIAAIGGHQEVVTMLLKHGADINAENLSGSTPLLMAAQGGYTHVVELLLKNKANPNAATLQGSTALWLAAMNGHVRVVELLLEKNANVNKVDNDGSSPLFLAAQNGHIEIVRLLLDNGAEINAAYQGGITPIWIAAQNGHKEIVELLLNRGANLFPVNSYNISPLDIAKQNGHAETVKLLEERISLNNKLNDDAFIVDSPAAKSSHSSTASFMQSLTSSVKPTSHEMRDQPEKQEVINEDAHDRPITTITHEAGLSGALSKNSMLNNKANETKRDAQKVDPLDKSDPQNPTYTNPSTKRSS